MTVSLGKNVLPFLGITGAGYQVTGAQATKAPAAFKTASYASIPYERHPQVTDTVPTKDKNGKPLLADYVTPDRVWVA